MKRNYLAYGFAISIVVHLIVLPFVRPHATAAQEEFIPPLHVDHHLPTPPPTAPPTPTPRPTQQPTLPPHVTPPPHTEPQRQLLIHPPHQDAHPHTGAGEHANTHTHGDPNAPPAAPGTAAPGPPAAAAAVPPAPTPTPTPHPTPTPLSCARPNLAPATLHAAAPDTPPMAQQQGIAGVVQVVVSLDTQSRVVGTRVLSSPSVVLNQAALTAARDSQFRTEVKNCEPVAADYIFSVDFTSQ